jgi:hypothetical protein
LVIFLRDGEEWDTLAYHPEEVTELYLGLDMDDPDKADIVRKAKAVNSGIRLFQMRRNDSGGLVCEDVT